jgi:hypothetical protein
VTQINLAVAPCWCGIQWQFDKAFSAQQSRRGARSGNVPHLIKKSGDERFDVNQKLSRNVNA